MGDPILATNEVVGTELGTISEWIAFESHSDAYPISEQLQELLPIVRFQGCTDGGWPRI